MAYNLDGTELTPIRDSESDNSEEERPGTLKIPIANASDNLLGANLTDRHPIYGDEKEVTFSSNRRKRSKNRAMKNLNNSDKLESSYKKSSSAVTTKEQSVTTNNPLKDKSYLSTSNKVSERKEEDEESSQNTKHIALPKENILEM